jgi:hypothetical protein
MKRKWSKLVVILALVVTPFLSGCGGSGGEMAEVRFSKTSLTFTNQIVGTTSTPQSLSIYNTGSMNLNISAISTSGPFTQSSNCPSQLSGGLYCTVNVTFAPKAGGAQTGTLTLADNAAGGPQTVALSGMGAAPSVSLSATSLTAGSFPVGTTSATNSLTLTDSGTGALSITSVTLAGPNAGDFALNSGCPSSLAAGANCLITFTFTPNAPGTRTAYINITDDAPGSPQTVTLSGTGEGPTLGLSASSLTFPSQAAGTSSAPQTITLTNTGNASLSFSSIGLGGASPGDFTQTNTCGSGVAAGNACTISVSFTPTAVGSFSATLAMADNVFGSPQSVVSLSGTGVAITTVSVSPTSLAFGDQAAGTTSPSQTVNVTNTGSADLFITSLGFSGTNTGDFTQNNNCSASIAPGSSCIISVVFTPVGGGSASASLQITDNVVGNPQVITLSGTGTHDVILTWAAVTTQIVAGYNIFRGTSPGGEGSTPINSTPIQGTSYIDESVSPGVTYYYVITALSQYGAAASAPSNEVSATVPSP